MKQNMIKYSNTKPPNWEVLQAIFKLQWEDGIIVTYGDTYYSQAEVEPDLVAHETVHMRQQIEMGIEEWWDKYCLEPKFRLSQEIEAYRAQVQYLRDNTESMSRNERRARIMHMALALSSHIYGNIIGFKEAQNAIKA